ncbi:MAG TPA: type II toxin-antitoxin system VapC family toxin [Thermoanaerobaculia bacterium]|jgi:PIN domain nuclease of toxin-antitoxin system|nr:type II toxin-antitoxin system VapC family toxin [Thermoanaerobaculia bacterium]
MKVLLDSHAFLWWLAEDPKLSAGARQAVADPSSIIHVSAATVWELSIKASLGKLDLDGADLLEEIEENDFIELPMTARHSLAAATLPRHHDDPFDRMLIAQAKLEGLTIITRDPAFRTYGVPLLPT